MKLRLGSIAGLELAMPPGPKLSDQMVAPVCPSIAIRCPCSPCTYTMSRTPPGVVTSCRYTGAPSGASTRPARISFRDTVRDPRGAHGDGELASGRLAMIDRRSPPAPSQTLDEIAATAGCCAATARGSKASTRLPLQCALVDGSDWGALPIPSDSG